MFLFGRWITSLFRNVLFCHGLLADRWPSKRQRQSWTVLLTIVLSLTILLTGLCNVISPRALAQVDTYDSPDEETPYETTAALDINIYDQTLTAYLYAPEEALADWTETLPQAETESAMAAAAGCQFDERDISIEDYLSGWGQCDALPQAELGWQGKLELSPLVALLKPTPMTHLSVTVSLPQEGKSRLNPAGESLYEDLAGTGWMQKFATNSRTYDIYLNRPDVTEISYWYGFTRGQIALDITGLLLVLVVPIAVMVWLRQRALSVHAKAQATGESVPIWFGYQRWSAWVETIAWFAWIIALSVSSAIDWIVLFLPASLSLASLDQNLLIALGMAVTLLPAMLMVLLNRCLSFRVMTEVGQLNYSFKEVLLQCLASQGLIVCIVVMILTAPALFTGHWISYVVITLAFIGIVLCSRTSKKLKDWTPYAITTGELRDRVFALAKPTGIHLKQLYLLPMQRSQMLNACAVSNDTVMVTDYLLKRLSKDEVDGIMAHEIAHLQLGHTKKLLGQLIFTGILIVWLMQMLSVLTMVWLPPVVSALQIPLGLLIVFVAFYSKSRKFEYQADAQGVLLTGNPQAAITGLVKLTRFNQMPMQWGKLSESFATHPSLQRRVSAIAKHYDLPNEEVDQLVAAASQELIEVEASEQALEQDASDNYYDLNTAELSDEQRPIFSSELQQKLGQQMLLASLACFTILPSVFGRVVAFLPTAGLRWIGYLIAGLSTIAIYCYVRNVGPTWGFDKLRQQLSAKLHSQGFEAISDVKKSTFVGFSPGAEIQVYESCTEWDVGFLVLASDQLYYVGERVKFAIAPEKITQATLSIESPEGLPIGAITLTWQREDLTSETYRFQPLKVRSVLQTKSAAKQLHENIEHWLANRQTDASGDRTDKTNPIDETNLSELAPPDLGTVTSQPFPKFKVSNFLVLWVLQLFIGNLIASALPTTGPVRLFIVVMVTIGTILQNWSAIRRTIS